MPTYNEVWIAVRTDGNAGTGTDTDPYDGSTQKKFDDLMRSFGPNVVIHLYPGTYQTFGWTNRSSNLGGVDPNKIWSPKAGWRILGGGIGNTIIKLGDDAIDAGRWYGETIGMAYDGTHRDFAEVANLSIDCDLQHRNPRPGTQGNNVMAVHLIGSFCKIHRVRAINWGSSKASAANEPTECFVLSTTGQAQVGNCLGAIIEECIVTEPAQVLFADGITAVIQADGPLRGGLIRHNFVYGIQTALGDVVGAPLFANAYTMTQSDGGIILFNATFNHGGVGVYDDAWMAEKTLITGNQFISQWSGLQYRSIGSHSSNWYYLLISLNFFSLEEQDNAVGICFLYESAPELGYQTRQPIILSNVIRTYGPGSASGMRGIELRHATQPPVAPEPTIASNIMDVPAPGNPLTYDAFTKPAQLFNDRNGAGDPANNTAASDLFAKNLSVPSLTYGPYCTACVLQGTVDLWALAGARAYYRVVSRTPALPTFPFKLKLPEIDAAPQPNPAKAWPGYRCSIQNASIVNAFSLALPSGQVIANVPAGVEVTATATSFGWGFEYAVERDPYEELTISSDDAYLTLRAGKAVNANVRLTGRTLYLPDAWEGWPLLLINSSGNALSVKSLAGTEIINLEARRGAQLYATDISWVAKRFATS